MENSIYKKIFDKIQESHYILLLTHKNPDPDTIGSALALGGYLQSIQKKYKLFNISKISIPRNLLFLKGSSKITDQLPKSYDLVIYLDCSEEYMIGTQINNEIFSIVIDHHITSKKDADLVLVDKDAGSTGEIVFDFFETNNIIISKDIATSLYVSIFSDTVGFTTSKVDHNTFLKVSKLVSMGVEPSKIAKELQQKDSLAKYRALPKVLESLELYNEGEIATIYCKDSWVEQSGIELNELDFVSNMVLNIAIVEVVAYFRKADQRIRVSLRGKGKFDLSKIAQHFHGGGHENAAGFYIDTLEIEDARVEFLTFIKNHTFD